MYEVKGSMNMNENAFLCGTDFDQRTGLKCIYLYELVWLLTTFNFFLFMSVVYVSLFSELNTMLLTNSINIRQGFRSCWGGLPAKCAQPHEKQ